MRPLDDDVDRRDANQYANCNDRRFMQKLATPGRLWRSGGFRPIARRDDISMISAAEFGRGRRWLKFVHRTKFLDLAFRAVQDAASGARQYGASILGWPAPREDGCVQSAPRRRAATAGSDR
jgi:hypothetical protein